MLENGIADSCLVRTVPSPFYILVVADKQLSEKKKLNSWGLRIFFNH
jgi:hypothetical protein